MENWKKPISIIFGIYSAILLILYVSFLLINREYVDVSTVGFVERLLSITTLSFLGFLLSYRRPENLISWLFVIIALMRQTGFLTTTVDILLAQGIEPTFGLLFWENLWFWWSGLTYSLLAFTIILFPNGRLPSPRWRLATGLLVLQNILTAGLILFLTYDLYQTFTNIAVTVGTITLTPLTNSGPFRLATHVRTIPGVDLLGNVIAFIALMLVLLALWSQIVRFRRGDRIEQQKIKWVVFAVILWAFAIFSIIIPIGIPIIVLAYVVPLIPIAIAVAILRYRLFDIDLIIQRTLLYGLLTILLALIFFASVTLLQSLVTAVSGQESPIIIVISTLAIARCSIL